MTKSIATLSALILVGLAVEAWAGPIEEVAQIAAVTRQGLRGGDRGSLFRTFRRQRGAHLFAVGVPSRRQGGDQGVFRRVVPTVPHVGASSRGSRSHGLMTITWSFRTAITCSI